MFPSELLKLNNWLNHRAKVPVDPKTGANASSQDSATWGSYDEAITRKDVDGIGFVPRTPYVGLDLDDCVRDGIINDFAKDVIRRCNSYTEFSPSGTGVHIILKGELPENRRTEKIELYQNGNYLTMTGRIIYPARPIRTVTKDFLASLVPSRTTNNNPQVADESWVLPALEGIEPNGPYEKTRTPVFTKVIGSLKRRGLKSAEVISFLSPWSDKYGYGIDRLTALVNDQFKRYPVEGGTSPNAEGESSDIENFLTSVEAVEWIVPGMIATKSIGYFCGLPETCKTWALMDLAIEAARGGVWLGRYPVKLMKTMFINQERSKAETQRRLKALIQGKDINLKELKEYLLIKSGTSIRLNLEHSFNGFRKNLAEEKPELLIIDSYSTFHSLAEESNTDNMIIIEKLKSLRDEFGVAILFVDHESKKGYQRKIEGREPNMGDQSGASAKSRAAEVMFSFVNQGQNSSFVYHTKSTQGSKVAPFLVEVADLVEDKSKIQVRAI